MKYGFVIDNRKCIGCHACTTACKAEHEVPVGVNRTWVKQVEQGTFPDTRRLFSVMRCNHCTDAPCVDICPTEALYTRADGIVDFDKDRCIGCKSCMQACPYDALYIDPDTHTAAKCNYCAHRIDVGLEPACVNVCPEHAIISGDMENSETEIAQLLSEHITKVRSEEKNTKPNVFYIDAEDVSLVPTATLQHTDSFWGSQSRGVGHFAKEAEKMAFSNADVVTELINLNGKLKDGDTDIHAPKSVEVLMNNSKRVYDSPQKGILWGWEVSAYVWTKAISAGAILIPAIAFLVFGFDFTSEAINWSVGISLLALIATGILLIKDLDRPDRFLYVLLRPHWKSWLVKGGYAITVFGGLTTLLGLSNIFGWNALITPVLVATSLVAIIVAVYTAFLFAQAKGRDLWQSKLAPFHMLNHALMAGAAIFLLVGIFVESFDAIAPLLKSILIITLVINGMIMLIELLGKHNSIPLRLTVESIKNGRFKNRFYLFVLGIGHIVPLLLLLFGGYSAPIVSALTISVLIGIYCQEDIWVSAPQHIPLS